MRIKVIGLVILSVLLFGCASIPTAEKVKPKTASKVWEVNIGEMSGFQPIVVQDKLIIGTKSGLLKMINIKNGEKVWDYNTGRSISSRPLVQGDVIFFGDAQGLHAVDLQNGNEKWFYSTIEPVYCQPVQYNNSIVFTDSNNVFYQLDVNTGEYKWKYIVNESVSSLVKVQNDNAYFGDFKNIYILDIKNNKEKYKKSFETGFQKDIESVKDKIIYLTSGAKVYCISEDGKDLWKFDAKTVVSSLVIDNNRIYFTNFKGQVFSLDAATGKEIWNRDLSGQIITAKPVVSDNIIYIGINSVLFALDAKTGEKLWSYSASGDINTTPIVFENKIVFTTRQGKITLIELN